MIFGRFISKNDTQLALEQLNSHNSGHNKPIMGLLQLLQHLFQSFTEWLIGMYIVDINICADFKGEPCVCLSLSC